MTTNTSTPTETQSNNIASADQGNSEPQAEQFQLAYEQLAAERAALTEDRVERINVDIPKTVNTVFGFLPQIQALSKEVKGLAGFDAERFDKIERYTQALAFSQMLLNAASEPIEYVPEVAAQVAAARERLLADAQALSTRGFLDGSRLKELKGGPGYKNIAYDVGTLVAMMRAVWPKIAGKTAVSEDELKSAQMLAEKLLRGVAAREQQELDITAAGEQRARAFTLLAQAYDDARRAATFLRWGQDIEQIVPSFYNGRGTSKKHPDQPVGPTPPSPAAPTNGNGADAAPKPAPGMPGASPYVS